MKPFKKMITTLSLLVILQALAEAAPDLIFATVASGSSGSWQFRTVFRALNETDVEQEFRFQFENGSGELLSLPLIASWAVEGRLEQDEENWILTLPAGSSAEVAVVPEGPFQMNWARVQTDSDIPVTCFLQVGEGNLQDPDIPLFEDLMMREVEIKGSPGARSFSFPVTFVNSIQAVNTAFALVNLSAAATEVELVFRPDTVKTIQLERGAILTAFSDEFWGLGFPEIIPFRLDGVAEVRSQSPLAVTVFRTLQGLPLSGLATAELAEVIEPGEAVIGEEAELKFGETVRLAGTDVELTFWNVREDSRCAIGATCVWEGRAVIEMKGSFADGQQQFELISHAGNQELATVVIGGYSIELKAVEPFPDLSQGPITLEDYLIRLLITPADE